MPADRAAAALAALLRPEAAFDLILGGGRQSIGEEGLLAPLLAAALGIPLAGTAEQLAVRCNSAKQQLLLVSPQGKRQRPLPAAVQMQAVLPLRKFTIADYLRSARRTVEILPWPAAIEAVPLTFVSQAAVHLETTGEEQPDQLLPLEASQLVLETLGLNGSHAGPASSRPRGLMPDIHDVQSPFLSASESLCVLAVLATDEEGQPQAAAAATIGAAQFLAQSFRVPCAVLVLTPATPEAQQQAARAVLEIASCDTLLVPLASDSSEDVRRRFLVEIWAQLQPQVQAVVGEPWTEAALAVLAGPQLATQRFLARILELDRQQGKLSVETSRLSGKVRCQQWLTLTEGETCWLTLSEGAQIGAMTLTGTSDLRLERWQPNMERFYQRDDMRRLLAELQQETGLLRLSDADFIIDVGFGIGNRDGYEEVIMPLEEALRQLGCAI